MFCDNLKELRLQKELNKRQMAEKLDLPYTTYNNYETGAREPGPELIARMANTFSVSADMLLGLPAQAALSEEDSSLLARYHSLDAHGVRTVDAVLTAELARVAVEAAQARAAQTSANVIPFVPRTKPSTIRLPQYECGVGAGPGVYAESDACDYIEIADTPSSRSADYALRISGDSMEPYYHDGDLLLVEQCDTLSLDSEGVFILNGESYFKLLGRDGLRSYNPDYPTIPVTEDDDFHCRGRVIGTAEEV